MRVLQAPGVGFGGNPILPPPPPGAGITDWYAGARYEGYLSPVNTIAGDPAGFTVAMAVRVGAPGLYAYILQQSQGSPGWGLRTLAGEYAWEVGTTYGGGSTVHSPNAPISFAGKVDRVVLVWDAPNNLIRMYLNGWQQGAGSVMLGTVALNTSGFLRLGYSAMDYALMGLSVSNTILDDAAVTAWDNSVKAAGSVVALPSANVTYRAQDAGDPPGNPWNAVGGVHPLPRVGNPVHVAFTPDWG